MAVSFHLCPYPGSSCASGCPHQTGSPLSLAYKSSLMAQTMLPLPSDVSPQGPILNPYLSPKAQRLHAVWPTPAAPPTLQAWPPEPLRGAQVAAQARLAPALCCGTIVGNTPPEP